MIVASLNRHHAIWLNYQKFAKLIRLQLLFKRLFYHFSNTYTSRKVRNTLKFEKDYEAICREWLGGLKPRSISLVSKSNWPHLEAVQSTDIISTIWNSARQRDKA